MQHRSDDVGHPPGCRTVTAASRPVRPTAKKVARYRAPDSGACTCRRGSAVGSPFTSQKSGRHHRDTALYRRCASTFHPPSRSSPRQFMFHALSAAAAVASKSHPGSSAKVCFALFDTLRAIKDFQRHCSRRLYGTKPGRSYRRWFRIRRASRTPRRSRPAVFGPARRATPGLSPSGRPSFARCVPGLVPAAAVFPGRAPRRLRRREGSGADHAPWPSGSARMPQRVSGTE